MRDNRPADQREKFTSKILPSYPRRTKVIEKLIPWLYLRGVSTNDFDETLEALLGPDAVGLSPNTITRFKSTWADEYKQWASSDLSDRHYVYVWADGVHFNIRLEDAGADRQCILVLMGATTEGKKELTVIADGYRESEQSWKELLLSVKHHGIGTSGGDPKPAIGDGAFGFWAAVREVWPMIDEQRCWVHKTANVLNKMPKRTQPKAKTMLHNIWQAYARETVHKAFDLFIDTSQAKHPQACE
ncbi:MAG: IS256 family transposase [bacterium]